jgi:5-methyltetrahydropteroyltriglutamate--homocysteine methyltransferase
VPHNIDRILTTHVGSLIRPPNLIEFWHLIEDGKPYEEAAFEACLTESVTEVVRQQADVGIDIVSDGEFSKGLILHFQTPHGHRGTAGNARGA